MPKKKCKTVSIDDERSIIILQSGHQIFVTVIFNPQYFLSVLPA